MMMAMPNNNKANMTTQQTTSITQEKIKTMMEVPNNNETNMTS
jgi:hypothetical protein